MERRSLLAAGVAALGVAPALAAAQQPQKPLPERVKEALKGKAGPFRLLVTFQVKEGMTEDFVKGFKPCLEATVKEDGCKEYELCASGDDKLKFALFEHWTTVAALEKHLQTEHVKGLFAAIGPALAENGVKLTIYTKAETKV